MNRRIPTSRHHSRSGFVDSSAFHALVSTRDANHAAALVIAQRLNAERWHLFTTDFVRAEAHALILNRVGHHAADTFLRTLRVGSPTTIIRVDERDEEKALALIDRYRDKDFSLTDATSFIVMERLGITNAFTFDDDFRQYGWIVLS